MKTIEIKEGNKTKIKIVPDDYEPEDNFACKDIAANGGFSALIDKEDWNRIFGGGSEKKDKEND